MAMVNPIMNMVNVKDSRWLTLEVCREYQRNKCSRPETECKFAHPPPHVEVQNGRVTCCFDSIKGKCQRKDPPCKYLHPPQHLREQLLQNGRNNLILKNLQMQALATGTIPPQMVPGMIPTMTQDSQQQPQSVTAAATDSLNGYYLQPWPYNLQSAYRSHNHLRGLDAYSHAVQNMYEPSAKPLPLPPAMLSGQYPMLGHPFLTMQNAGMYANPYMSASPLQGMGGLIPTADNGGGVQLTAGGQVPVGGSQGKVRADRLEQTPTSAASEASWTGSSYTDSLAHSSQLSPVYFQPQVVEVLTAPGKKRPRDPADELVLGMPTMPSMVQYVKRPAVDNKSGIPVYQPGTGTTAYQQAATIAAMQLQQQQPFVPVTIAGHPPSVPRF